MRSSVASVPALGAAQHGAHPGDQLLGTEWLDHVVVGAELQAGHPVRLVAAGSEDHDRHRRVAPQGADDVQAVQPRQPEVQDDGVGTSRPGEREAAGTVAGDEHRKAPVFEVVADEAGDLRLVLHDEDRAHEAPGRG